MRSTLVIASLVLAAGVAHATQDDYRDIQWVATSVNPDAIVVEVLAWSLEAEGQGDRTSWLFQQPAGVVQATIFEPYSKRPRLQMAKKSTLDKAKLEAIVAGLVTANAAKPRPKPSAIRKEVAPTLGITLIEAAKKCPAKVTIGKKRITVSLDTASSDAGASKFVHPDVEKNWDRTPPAVNGPSMRSRCYPHTGGVLVVFKLHAAMEGDIFWDRIAFVPGATLP